MPLDVSSRPAKPALSNGVHLRSSDGLTHALLALHHWYVHRCQTLGWHVHSIVTAPSSEVTSSASVGGSVSGTRRSSHVVVHTSNLVDGYGCPYCQRGEHWDSLDERIRCLRDWLCHRASPTRRAQPHQLAPNCPHGEAAAGTTRTHSRLYRFLCQDQGGLLVWMSALGVSEGTHTLRGCALLPRTAGAVSRGMSLRPSSPAPADSHEASKKSSSSVLPPIRKLPPGTSGGGDAKKALLKSPSTPDSAYAPPHTLNTAVPIGFFMLPSFDSVNRVSPETLATLQSLPRYVAGQTPALSDRASPSPLLSSDVWLYQRHAHWSATRRRRAPELHPVHVGSVIACDVFLIREGTAASSFAVWGVASNRPSSPAASLVEGQELFLIAASLEAYVRLGLMFGWVYGWQLCYSSRGPPAASVPWLRLFNPSALAATESLRAGSRRLSETGTPRC